MDEEHRLSTITFYHYHSYSSFSLSDPTVAKKDLDFIEKGEKLKFTSSQVPVFLDQLRKDAKFFADNNIIDYSLLVGVHNLNQRREHDIMNSNNAVIFHCYLILLC